MAGEYVVVGKASEIALGQFKPVKAGGKNLLVCHTESGFHVIDDTCTHDDGPLADGWLEGEAIECPRHGARFDVANGKVLCLPAAVPINSYRVAIDGDSIKADLTDVIPR